MEQREAWGLGLRMLISRGGPATPLLLAGLPRGEFLWPPQQGLGFCGLPDCLWVARVSCQEKPLTVELPGFPEVRPTERI